MSSSHEDARSEAFAFADVPQDRLAVLGHIAAAVAHELNNWLFVIRGFSELARMEIGDDHAAAAKLQRVEEATDRCELLNRMILESAHPSGAGNFAVQIHPIVKEALKLVRSSCPGDLPVSQAVDAEGPIVAVDPVRLFPAVVTLIGLAAEQRATAPGHLRVDLGGEPSAPAVDATRLVLHVAWLTAEQSNSGAWDRLRRAADDAGAAIPDGDRAAGVAAAFAAFGGRMSSVTIDGLGSCWRLEIPAAVAAAPTS